MGIGKTRKIVQFVWSKEFCGALFGTEMHKCQACSFGFNLWANSGELGDRLAAKRSTKMPQKNQQRGMAGRNIFERLAGLRTIQSQKLRINVLCLKHCWL